MNDYYDVSLKEERLKILKDHHNFAFIKGDLIDKPLINKLFKEYHFDIVVNLATQAGVRYSIINSDVYINFNIIGFYNILKTCIHNPVQH